MTINELMSYLKQLNFDIPYTSVRNGIEEVKKQVQTDSDLAEIIYNLQ